MDEKLAKFINMTSIPAILIVFYTELKAIDNHLIQIERLRHSIEQLEVAIKDCQNSKGVQR